MLDNKVIVVTGGAGLLGRVFVKKIMENRGIGIIADINEDAGGRVVRELREELKTGTVDFIKLDVTSKESINTMIAAATGRYGKINALVNNAYPRNKQYGRHFFDVQFEDFCENVNLQLGGYFLVSQQMALYFSHAGGGNIINLASIYGVNAPRFEIYEGTRMTMPVEYAAAKSATLHLTRYMAKYLKHRNIRVNAISPGGILDGQPQEFLDRYNQHGLSRGMLMPDDISGTLLFLLSDESRYINGQNLIVDDGWVL